VGSGEPYSSVRLSVTLFFYLFNNYKIAKFMLKKFRIILIVIMSLGYQLFAQDIYLTWLINNRKYSIEEIQKNMSLLKFNFQGGKDGYIKWDKLIQNGYESPYQQLEFLPGETSEKNIISYLTNRKSVYDELLTQINSQGFGNIKETIENGAIVIYFHRDSYPFYIQVKTVHEKNAGTGYIITIYPEIQSNYVNPQTEQSAQTPLMSFYDLVDLLDVNILEFSKKMAEMKWVVDKNQKFTKDKRYKYCKYFDSDYGTLGVYYNDATKHLIEVRFFTNSTHFYDIAVNYINTHTFSISNLSTDNHMFWYKPSNDLHVDIFLSDSSTNKAYSIYYKKEIN
jgi:hypothetical protein